MAIPEQPAEPTDAPGVAAGPPPVADGVERPLDPRAVALHRTVGWILAGAVSLGLLVPLAIVLVAASPPGWITASLVLLWAALALALGWRAQRWPEVAHRHASYRVDAQGIEIRRGVYWRKVIGVPRSRVQHTDVSQGPLERGHGLGTLVLYTAGTDHARVDLPGLDHGTALCIRDHLLARQGPGEEDDAV